ncbi:hypothetical protein D3C80_1310290 [compost metagenome]
MQVRAGAVAGVAGFCQRAPVDHPLSLANHHRTTHQVQIDTHGAVVMQNPHEIARRVRSAPALVVLGLDHGTCP